MNKKKLITFISIAVGLSIILFLLTLVPTKTDESEITKLTDEKIFYELQDAISKHIINSNKYTSPEFTLKNVYYKQDGLITYYHANGYILDFVMEDYNYESNVNYSIIVKGNSYTIFELKQSQTEKYLDTFNKEDYKFENGNVFSSITFTEQNKLTSYITVFTKLLSIDSSKAYQMLNTTTKNKYSNYSNFLKNSSDIYDKLDITIKTYKKETSNNMTIYTITDSNNNTIKIYETSIMDYKIDY